MVAVQAKYIILCVVIYLYLASEVSAKFTKLRYMRMRAGDMIQCEIRNYPIFTHWMLATRRDGYMIHVAGTSGDKIRNTIMVKEEHYLRIDRNYDKCRNHGGGLAGEFADLNAYKLKNQSVYYNLLTCNCEHYVKYWAGELDYNSNQSGWGASEACDFFRYDREAVTMFNLQTHYGFDLIGAQQYYSILTHTTLS